MSAAVSIGPVDLVADRLTDDLARGRWEGVEIVTSQALPIRPSLGEWCRRYTRHQWGPELLAWMGLEVGPAPDDVTHVVYAHDGVTPRLMVSPQVHEQIVGMLAVLERYGTPGA